MTAAPLHTVSRFLRHVAGGGGLTDEQLLARFVAALPR